VKYAGLWDPIKIEIDETISIQLGSLNLWIHRGEQEWYIAFEHRATEMERLSVSRCREMADLEWTRWMINERVDEIKLHPCMPDRPVIVRPEMPISLLPKQSVQFFIGVPIWIGISLDDRFHNITEIPSMILSNSWFGPTTEGEGNNTLVYMHLWGDSPCRLRSAMRPMKPWISRASACIRTAFGSTKDTIGCGPIRAGRPIEARINGAGWSMPAVFRRTMDPAV